MGKLYNSIKKLTTASILAITLLGCERARDNVAPNQSTSQKFYFEQFGVIDDLNSIDNRRSVALGIGDMDGDGRNDIVLIDRAGNLVIYENRIPPKAKYSEKPEALDK